MRFWCVPSATDLESPKLPPRINRDVYLRSPPPPPRLSREEKLARGVLAARTQTGSAGKTRKKKKTRKRKVAASASGSGLTSASSTISATVYTGSLVSQASAGSVLVEHTSLKRTPKKRGGRKNVLKEEGEKGSLGDRSASLTDLQGRSVATLKSQGAQEVSGSLNDQFLLLPKEAETLILHPGKSKSRENKKNKVKKRGKKCKYFDRTKKACDAICEICHPTAKIAIYFVLWSLLKVSVAENGEKNWALKMGKIWRNSSWD